MNAPALAISYQTPAQAADFEAALELLRANGQHVEAEEREPSGPFAGLEWLIPTAVIFFIGKAYVEGFVKEIGKDHYILLKSALKTLWKRMVGPESPALTVIGTAGKTRAASDYSLFFSLMAEAPDGLRIKLLIKSRATQEEYEATTNAFIDFIDAFHRLELTQEFIEEAAKIPAVGRTLVVVYDPALQRIRPMNPLAGRPE